MELGPFTLDDNRAREQIAQILETNRPQSFVEELDTWLDQHWGQDTQDTKSCPTYLAGMIREEDVHIVLDHAFRTERQKDAFYLFWASGLFREAGCLLEGYPEVRQEVGFDYLEEDGAAFEASLKLSRWKIWNGPKGILPSLYYEARHLWSDPTYDAYPVSRPRTIILTREPGTEKDRIARAIHEFSGGVHFEEIDCSHLTEVPQEQIERCLNKGTVYFSRFEALKSDVHPHILQVISERRLLKSISTASGERSERLELNSLFIVGIDSPLPGLRITGWLWDKSKIGITGTVKQLPPLTSRFDDVPLLVNKILLEIGATELDDVRHWIADTLIRHMLSIYQQRAPVGGVEWLRNEVKGWVQEFSPVVLRMTDHDFFHTDDYRVIRHRGTQYELTSRSADIVKILHEAHRAKETITRKGVMAKLGGGRWADAFQSQDLRGTVIVPGSTTGTIRLNL